MGGLRRRDTPKLVIANWRDRSHPQAGGAEAVCEQLAKRYAAKGHDVVLLTAAVPGRPSKERRDGYTVMRRGDRFTVYIWALLWLVVHRGSVEAVIDSQNGIPFFTPLVVRRTTPVVLLLHHVHQEQFGLYFSPLAAAIGRWLERTGSRVVYGNRAVAAVSPSTRQRARQRLGLRGTIYVVPPGWDMPEASVNGPQSRQPRESIVCVGRLVPHKRTELVIKAMPAAMESLPNLELHIVGEGSERPKLERLVARLGLAANVTIYGALESTTRDRILSTAWLTVNASQGEGWGLSVIEANALGVPALAYRHPGLRDSIRHGETGWLIDDEDDLAGAIIDVLGKLKDARYAAEISQRAEHWSALFTWDVMASQVMGIVRAERGRLAQLNDRRVSTDLAAVVRVPASILPDDWRPVFRLTDKWVMNRIGLAVLLPGADNKSSSAALRRAALPESIVTNPAIRVDVARPRDFISPVADLFGDFHWTGNSAPFVADRDSGSRTSHTLGSHYPMEHGSGRLTRP